MGFFIFYIIKHQFNKSYERIYAMSKIKEYYDKIQDQMLDDDCDVNYTLVETNFDEYSIPDEKEDQPN
jgi:hypothetical protein